MRPFHQTARLVLVAFLVTFVATRCLVFLIMARRVPDLFLHIGGTHVHHLNYGIFLLSGVAGYLLFARPEEKKLTLPAVLYGVGMALTFDEFGMWLHLSGGYWQRASWDAIAVFAAIFALIAFSPNLSRLGRRGWITAGLILTSTILFYFMLWKSFEHARESVSEKLRKLESAAPD